MAETLQVEKRETRGKKHARRMRSDGKVPAVLYGHGQENVSLAVQADDLDKVLRRGTHVVQLAGAVEQNALIRELQWNTWGTEVVHIDFTRVSADELVTVMLVVELRGEAPGLKEGGVIEHQLHNLEVECKATEIPEKIRVNVNSLEIDQSITVADLELPDGTKCQASPTDVVVQCVMPAEVLDEEEGEAAEAEPEVIGGKKEDEEGKGK